MAKSEASGVTQGPQPVRSGHWKALTYFASAEMSEIVSLFDHWGDIGGCYFRLTNRGIQPVDLHVSSPKPLIGVGGVIRTGTAPAQVEAELPGRVSFLIQKRAGVHPSREKQLEAQLIGAALQNGLRLDSLGPSLRFIAGQWRLDLPNGAQLLDLLAVDVTQGDMVVVELKSDYDPRSIDQVRGYLHYLVGHLAELGPFFQSLARAMADRYKADDLRGITLSGSARAVVAWPGKGSTLEVHQVSKARLIAPAQLASASYEHAPYEGDDAATVVAAGITPGTDRYGPQYSRDSAFAARMRFHQSWWRADVLGVPCGIGPTPSTRSRFGNMLETTAADAGMNFLTPAIAEIARERMQAGGGVEPFRCTRNMLSSQPMCFNLFAPLQVMTPALATACVAALLPDPVAWHRFERVAFEYAPSPKHEFLDDGTAFDAFIEFEQPDGSVGFIGIETKLTEPFSQKIMNPEKYLGYAREFPEVWQAGAVERLVDLRWFQLWRNHLLAKRLAVHPGHGFQSGLTLVVYHQLDTSCTETVANYRSHLMHPDDEVVVLTLGVIVERWKPIVADTEHATWLADFEKRYVDLSGSEEPWRSRTHPEAFGQ